MIINAENHLTIRKINGIDDNPSNWGLMYEGNINKEYLKESYLSKYCSKNKVYLLKCPDYKGLKYVNLSLHIPQFVIEEVREKHIIFAVDCSSEANYEMVDVIYSEVIDKLDVPADQVLLIATSTDLKSYMSSLHREPFKIECFDFFERLMQRQMRYVLSPTEKVPKLNSPLLNDTFDKKYICLNRIQRPHRLALLKILNKKNLVEQGHYSFALNNDTYEKLDGVDSLYPTVDMDSTQNVFKKLPLEVDTSKIIEVNHAYSPQRELFQFYKTSYFSIVTETYFENNSPKFFTEKIFKPIIHKHPFVLLSNPHMLAHLRSYGYKTFDGIIDESYDKIENDSDRLVAVGNEIERLCNLNESKLKDFRHDCLAIVNHNYETIMKKINFIKDL